MLFNSLHFIIFFPLVVTLYFLIRHKYRWALLLMASYYFYMSWKAEYALLIIISTIIDYFAALQMHKANERKKRIPWLILSLISNIGILFFFKYANFFAGNLNVIFEPFRIEIPYSDFLLPVGISFYTFQTLAYTIDVYRKKIAPQKHLGKFALYVSFFPQLVAGPIERAQNLLPQFETKNSFDYNRVVSGLRLMLWGFFKKIVVADTLAIYVNAVYNDVGYFEGLPLLWATFFFAFQIYCDFSGYSDIAVGAARVMGYDLMQNFKVPYMAKSIREFWGRWHVSLSTWFRDYLYISIGGNKVSVTRWYINLVIVFVVSGLWHGANWTFIIWGFLHGAYLTVGIILNNWMRKIKRYEGISVSPNAKSAVSIIITFMLVLFSWVFFRANSIEDAFYIIENVWRYKSGELIGLSIISKQEFIFNFIAIMLVFIPELLEYYKKELPIYVRFHSKVSIISPLVILLLIYLFGVFENQEFIYFQF